MQASFIMGEVEGLSAFSQYNPHGVFIALEDIGYLLMAVAFFFLGLAFSPHSMLERALRLLFLCSGLLVIGMLILLAVLYGHQLEYRFEVASLLIDWVTLIITGIPVSVVFHRSQRLALASGKEAI